jgi:hypothetical protein
MAGTVARIRFNASAAFQRRHGAREIPLLTLAVYLPLLKIK